MSLLAVEGIDVFYGDVQAVVKLLLRALSEPIDIG